MDLNFNCRISNNITLNTIQLEKQLLGICRTIDAKLMDGVSVEMSVKQHVCESLIIELRAQIYGTRLPKRHVVRFPSNWKEAFKERWFPAFLREKFPVKYTVIEANLLELYPDLNIKLPDKRPVLQFLMMDRSEEYYW